MKATIIGCLALGLTALSSAPVMSEEAMPTDDFGAMVKEFSAARHKLAVELAEQLDLVLPKKAVSFFEAAEAGDWAATSNRFQKLKTPGDSGWSVPSMRNELWATVHETLGVWEVWVGWKQDSALLRMFYEPILSSMPEGSIYFGGTDCGRFVVTTANALKQPPPVFVLTQNGLADNTYMAHLRAVYGDRLWIPEQEDSNQAFQEYVEDVQAGRYPAGAEVSFEDGRVTVQGVAGVMMINGILCRMIFERNKDEHPFFLEESYVVDWMYPYLEPHGLILKLNPEPLPELTADAVERDRQFWKDTLARLESQPGWASNPDARKAFSKLRSAIAGVYVYRKKYDEAEAAFRQAIDLYRFSPEAHMRLAKMYEEQDRLEEARDLMVAFMRSDPPEAGEQAGQYLDQLETKVRAGGEAIPVP
ncbi:MAG TPA: tetratricopeptide repeat protein [Kiritimatiellia bacterium]|nr:tetratricopeptide repeat protein [Kiritimatiellia bacterium]HRZ13029.1 tetratricopeptide repeat protein [Kiritimatiellia bacterium]HSA18361.1 tetratricopeptide repeat protein [Kiritimatiellia bacterium]